MNIKQSIQQAIAHYQAGQLEDSERIFNEVLQIAPKDPDANHNLGVLYKQRNQLESALYLFRTALEANPGQDQFWISCIDVLIDLGQMDAAQAVLEQGKKQGLQGDAVVQLENRLSSNLATRSESIENQFALTQHQIDLIVGLHSNGQNQEALDALKLLINQYPEEAVLYNIMGVCFASLNDLGNAVESYQQALTIKPNYAEAHYNLGGTLKNLNELDLSIKSYEKALEINPSYAEAHFNLGSVFQALKKYESAISCYKQVLKVNPFDSDAYCNQGVIFHGQYQFDKAINYFKQALQINSENVDANYNLGVAYKDIAQVDEAVNCFKHTLKLQYNHFGAYENLLFTLNYSNYYDSSYYLQKARKFSTLLTSNVTHVFSKFNNLSSPQRLRVGFISGDLINHPVGFFLEGTLSKLFKNNFEFIAYSNNKKFDDLSMRIRPYFYDWKLISGLDDERTANLIHNDGVHILIDLSGHNALNRLSVFAWRPAPIQVSWLGYFATTGLASIDYLIGDPYVTPEKNDSQFTEIIYRLPETRWCFTVPHFNLQVSTLPALNNKFITFGCFNNLTKLNDQVIQLWSKVLNAIPKSRLFLKNKQLKSIEIQQMIFRKFVANGINPERIRLEGSDIREKYLNSYNRVDIALDPFPFPGGTTSLEGLWMGVPLLTLSGHNMVSNQGVSILINAGLSDWVAQDKKEYLAKAISLSTDIRRLNTLRSGLREQIMDSPLFNANRFADHFKNALWNIWNQYENNNSSDKQRK